MIHKDSVEFDWFDAPIEKSIDNVLFCLYILLASTFILQKRGSHYSLFLKKNMIDSCAITLAI